MQCRLAVPSGIVSRVELLRAADPQNQAQARGVPQASAGAVLRAQGVFTRKVSVLPRPVTPATFSDAIQSIDNGTSAAMYHALQGAHLLDLRDMLVQDPRCARREQCARPMPMGPCCTCVARNQFGSGGRRQQTAGPVTVVKAPSGAESHHAAQRA